MSGKDIALTVGGILATMMLAYMFYRRQQEQAAAASSAQQAQDMTNPNYYDQSGVLFDASAQYAYGSQLPSLSVPSSSPTVPASTVAPAVDTSSTTAAGHDASSQITDILGQYFNEYMSGAQQQHTADFSTLIIPALNLSPGIDITEVPLTAAQAMAGIAPNTIDQGSANVPNPGNIYQTLSTAGVIGGAVASPTEQPVSDTVRPSSSAQNFHYNHVLALNPS